MVQVRTLVPPTSAEGRAPAEVTQLAAAPASPHIAAGHSDGTIRIWNLDTGECEVSFYTKLKEGAGPCRNFAGVLHSSRLSIWSSHTLLNKENASKQAPPQSAVL